MSSDQALQRILASLNKQQLKAVTYNYDGALQVIAGPGTGKTKVLTSRVAYLLLHHKINPRDIIVTTFTNKAAKEMIDRLQQMLQGTSIDITQLLIGTFHGICLKILLRYGDKIGLENNWKIVDEKESDSIINSVVEKMPDQTRDYALSLNRKVNLCLPKKDTGDWVVHPKMVKKNISKLKSSAILHEEYNQDDQSDSALQYLYEAYQMALKAVNGLDFDDLLMYTFRLLTKFKCLPNIKHVLVDEFQDTNGIQTDLMFLFAKGNHHLSRGITVVGDPDQSIYAFRYALSHNFEDMARKSPLNISQVVLVENYRSSQKILNTSESLISQQNQGRKQRLPLNAQFDCDFSPVYLDFPTHFLEAPSLVRELIYLKSLPSLFTFDDFAFLVRQRRQIRRIENTLIEYRIPYKIIRGRAFWEALEISAMLNLIRCVGSDDEHLAICDSLLYPARGLGKVSVDKLKKLFDDNKKKPFETLKDVNSGLLQCDIPTKGKTVIKNFIDLIMECRTVKQNSLNSSLTSVFETLYDKSGLKREYLYLDGKKKSEVSPNAEPDYSNPRHKNIEVLKTHFLGFTKDGTNSDVNSDKIFDVSSYVHEFLMSLALFASDMDGKEDTSDPKRNVTGTKTPLGHVTISTIHGAKGLEWPVVFIPGCTEGIIPSLFGEEMKESQEDGSDDEGDNSNKPKSLKSSPSDILDEERRMFFVAQTRAKFILYMSSVSNDEEQYQSNPSRFLSTDLLKSTADRQDVFKSKMNIDSLYHALGKHPAKNIPSFSFNQLIKDYNKFTEGRRERLFWNNSVIMDPNSIDFSKNHINVDKVSISAFTTAAIELKRTNSKILQKKSEKNFAPIAAKVAVSPSKNYAPDYNNPVRKGSPSPKRNYAPTTNSQSRSPSPKKSFAPTNYSPKRNTLIKSPKKNYLNKGLKLDRDISDLDLKSPPRLNNNEINLKKNYDNKKIKILNTSSIPKENLDDVEISSQFFKKRTTKANRRLITKPINLQHDLVSNIEVQANKNHQDNFNSSSEEEGLTLSESFAMKMQKEEKKENISEKRSIFYESSDEEKPLLENEVESINTTAAEILHDPLDMTVDNRPIITSAKTLAKAITTKKKTVVKTKVKKEVSSSQMDILTQLSRAKKKAKSNDGEIIIID